MDNLENHSENPPGGSQFDAFVEMGLSPPIIEGVAEMGFYFSEDKKEPAAKTPVKKSPIKKK